MKLYATITSDRASKGQGGNKKIEILLQVDPKRRLEVGRLVMTEQDELYEIYYYPITTNVGVGGRTLLYSSAWPDGIKGNARDSILKGGKYLTCTWCGKNPPESKLSEYCSEKCRYEATGKRTKGEKQKGKQAHDPRTCENSVPCVDCENLK